MTASLIDRSKQPLKVLYAVEKNKRTVAIFDDYHIANKYMQDIENKENFYISLQSFELNKED